MPTNLVFQFLVTYPFLFLLLSRPFLKRKRGEEAEGTITVWAQRGAKRLIPLLLSSRKQEQTLFKAMRRRERKGEKIKKEKGIPPHYENLQM